MIMLRSQSPVKRVQQHAAQSVKKRPATQWVQPGEVKLRVKHLRGEHNIYAALRYWASVMRRHNTRAPMDPSVDRTA